MIAASGFLHFAKVEIKKQSENNYKKMAGMQIYILEATNNLKPEGLRTE